MSKLKLTYSILVLGTMVKFFSVLYSVIDCLSLSQKVLLYIIKTTIIVIFILFLIFIHYYFTSSHEPYGMCADFIHRGLDPSINLCKGGWRWSHKESCVIVGGPFNFHVQWWVGIPIKLRVHILMVSHLPLHKLLVTQATSLGYNCW